MMKDTWKNNLGLKVAALLFSILLWWTVVNIDDPVDKAYYKVDVQLLNTEVITIKKGESFDILGSRTIQVTVKARRKILEAIKTSDIVATADFTELDETTNLVPIRIKINGFESRYEEVSSNPRNLQLKTEPIVKKTFPIHVEKYGEVRDGYVVANLIPEPQSIDISGPGSVLNTISKVVARVDVSELSKDSSLQAELIYYDSANNEVEKTTLTSDCDRAGVVVHVEVWRTKTLELKFDTSGIKTAAGYVFDRIQVEPNAIRVAGSDDIIIPMTQIEIPKEALVFEGLQENQQAMVDIAEYLPEGLVLADADASNVVVTIFVEKAGVKSISIPARSVKVSNASEEFEIAYDGEQEVELKFEGPNEELEFLTSGMISATIDMAEYTEEGTYDVPVQVADLSNQCKYLGGATVQITLTKK